MIEAQPAKQRQKWTYIRILIVESFSTAFDPYSNNLTQTQQFQCNENLNQTVHIRLDKKHGFKTQRNHDFLNVTWNGYKRRLHGTIDDLPNELKQDDWYDTESFYLDMEFESDPSIAYKGFKFDILCQKPNAQSDFFNDMRNERSNFITNDQKLAEFISKDVSCLTPSENVHYRLAVKNTVCYITILSSF